MDSGKPREITIANPTFFFTPTWSPDGKYLAFTDEGLNLSMVEVATGKLTRIDTDRFAHPDRTVNPVWSPDSKWVAYAKRLTSQFHVIMVYSLKDGKTRQLTDGLSDAVYPAWDPEGKFLYFLASTDFALNSGWLDLSSYDRPVNRGVYFAVLRADQPSPLLPQSDEETAKDTTAKPDSASKKPEKKSTKETKPKAAADSAKADSAVNVRIDFDGISQRILSLGVPIRQYKSIVAAADSAVFYAESLANEPGVTSASLRLQEARGGSLAKRCPGLFTLGQREEAALSDRRRLDRRGHRRTAGRDQGEEAEHGGADAARSAGGMAPDLP